MSRLTVSDITDQVAKWAEQTFSYVGVSPADNGATLVFADAVNKALKKWDVSTGQVTTVTTFNDPPGALINDTGVIYVGAGAKLYTYDPANDTTTLRQSFADNILGISPAGNYLLIDDRSGAWSTFSLVRKSDFAIVSQREWVNYSKTSVFIPSQSRVYLLRDGMSPNDICYQEIDFSTETLGAYGDSPYHGDYPFYSPLLQFGSDRKLVCGGNIFDITDTDIASKIKWWGNHGTTFADLLFMPDRILVLNSDRVSRLDLNSPYAEISALPAFTGEVGRKLFETATGVIVISEVSQSGRIVVRQYSLEIGRAHV